MRDKFNTGLSNALEMIKYYKGLDSSLDQIVLQMKAVGDSKAEVFWGQSFGVINQQLQIDFIKGMHKPVVADFKRWDSQYSFYKIFCSNR